MLDGHLAIQGMRAAGYDGLIIAVTGSANKQDQDKLMAAGATTIMLKPFDITVFQKIVLSNRHKLRF